jgi:Uma2 family endonuclease
MLRNAGTLIILMFMETPTPISGRNLRVPATALTLAGFRQWAQSSRFPERGHLTFIAGEVHVDMSPEEIRTHNSPKSDLIVDLTLEVRRRDLGQVFVDGVLLVNDAAELACEPDLMFCCWQTLQSDRVQLVEHTKVKRRIVELRGSPDLVIEIVSRSSVKKDTVDLRSSYHRAGIPEYWIIDARGNELKFSLLQHGPDGYVEALVQMNGTRHSVVLDANVRLTRETDRIGGWQYRLYYTPE